MTLTKAGNPLLADSTEWLVTDKTRPTGVANRHQLGRMAGNQTTHNLQGLGWLGVGNQLIGLSQQVLYCGRSNFQLGW